MYVAGEQKAQTELRWRTCCDSNLSCMAVNVTECVGAGLDNPG